jgi:hypothetical protein
VDLNGILCSCVQKSTVTWKGYKQKRFYPEGFVHSASVPTCVGPKAVYVRPRLKEFLEKLSEFADITVWSLMMQSTTKQVVVDYLFHGNVYPVVVYGQESCESIQVKKRVDLKYPKSKKSIFLKTLNTRFFLDNGCRYTNDNTILIDDSPEKSILNDIGNAIFLKSWTHILRNALVDEYLTWELGPWLEKLHREGNGKIPKYVNGNRLGVQPLAKGDCLFYYVMDGLLKVGKL